LSLDTAVSETKCYIATTTHTFSLGCPSFLVQVEHGELLVLVQRGFRELPHPSLLSALLQFLLLQAFQDATSFLVKVLKDRQEKGNDIRTNAIKTRRYWLKLLRSSISPI